LVYRNILTIKRVSQDLNDIIHNIDEKISNGTINSDIYISTGIQGIVDDFESKYKQGNNRNDVLTTLEGIKPAYDKKYKGGRKSFRKYKKRRSTKRKSAKRKSAKFRR
jgi:hypothetical protein